MHKKEAPARIHFYEEEPQRESPVFSSALTRFVRTVSFGLVKNDTQAGFIIIVILIGVGVGVYYYTLQNKGVEPTTQYELLPQESVGSTQGVPPPSLYE